MRIRGVSDELRRAFKILCAQQDISMNKKLIELMEKTVKDELKK